MEKITILLNKLLEILSLQGAESHLGEAVNKLNLYIKKYFKNNSEEYHKLLSEVIKEPTTIYEEEKAVSQLQSIILTMLEDLEISKDNMTILSEEEKNEFETKQRAVENNLNNLEEKTKDIQTLFAEIERQKNALQESEAQLSANKQLLQEKEIQIEKDRQIQQQALIEQEEKYKAFRVKLEMGDKNLDFKSVANTNKLTALIFAGIAGALIITLFIVLCVNITNSASLILITNTIKHGIINTKNSSFDISPITLYIGYAKYIISKLLIYSMLIYAIVFCIKNYNAQMHNFVVNTQKSNSLKSALSLIDTAITEDGKDKLLIQATQAIFSHQQSGYSGKDSEPNNPNLITNMIDTATSKI